jgi:nitroreductase
MILVEIKIRIKQFLRFVALRSDTFYLIYLVFVEKSFNREILSVRAGQAEIARRIRGKKGAEFRLRRNIHRLEKGLIMRPRRAVFARDYIAETVDAFSKIWELNRKTGFSCENSLSLRWYRDVLREYFSAVSSDPAVDPHRERFLALLDVNKVECGFTLSIPRQRKDYPASRISYEDILKLAERRRSVRWYLPQKVPRNEVDKAIKIAALSPSACNRQPFRFIICENQERVERIANLAGGTKGFAEQFPMIIVVVGCLDAYEHPRDRHLIYIDSALASMSFMLALETLGLSSCAINWPDVEDREIAIHEELKLPTHERAVMLISVGYANPDGQIPFSEKKSLSELRVFLCENAFRDQ